jgi:hypothetical protein
MGVRCLELTIAHSIQDNKLTAVMPLEPRGRMNQGATCGRVLGLVGSEATRGEGLDEEIFIDA